MPVLGEMEPLGPTEQTKLVAAASTSPSWSVPSPFASRPLSIFVPPKRQLGPADSATVRTRELLPTALQTYVGDAAPTCSLAPPDEQFAPAGSCVTATLCPLGPA